MDRATVYLHDDITDYLEQVRIENQKDYEKLNSMILKLAEHGHTAIDGKKFKFMKAPKKTKHPIVQIEILHKKYRIHTTLTTNFLYLLHAFDKKKNKTPKRAIELSINRAEAITQI